MNSALLTRKIPAFRKLTSNRTLQRHLFWRIDMRFKKITVQPSEAGAIGYHYYETEDGRFQIKKIYNSFGDTWQAKTTDGSEPFIGWKGRMSNVCNQDRYSDCKYYVEMVYARGA